MLDEIKLTLRLKTPAFDSELAHLIDSAKADLALSGVGIIDENDALTAQAIRLYCQAHFGADAQADRYLKSYTMLKDHLALSQRYAKEDAP